jgi:hypothetical protein
MINGGEFDGAKAYKDSKVDAAAAGLRPLAAVGALPVTQRGHPLPVEFQVVALDRNLGTSFALPQERLSSSTP